MPALTDTSGWSAAERGVLKALQHGNWAVPEEDNCDIADLLSGKHDWPETRTIRAGILASMLLNPPPSNPERPLRLQMEGYRVVGSLDLGCAEVTPFLFSKCHFDSIPNLNDCKASFVGFVSSRLPGITAERMRSDGPLWLQETQFDGMVNLEDAQVADIDAHAIKINPGEKRPAISGIGLRIGHDLNLAYCALEGGVLLSNAQIGGTLRLDKAEINADVAVRAYLAEIRGTVRATNATFTGAVDFELAKIGGACLMQNVRISNPGELALDLDHSTVGSALYLANAQIDGMLRLHHATVECQLVLRDCTVTNSRGTALKADHLMVHGSALINGSAKIQGAIDLHGAQIGCTLNLTGLQVSIEGELRECLSLDAVDVGGSLLAGSMLIAGVLNMTGSKVGQNVTFLRSRIEGASSARALVAEGCAVGRDVNLDRVFVKPGGISFEGAHVAGTLNVQDAEIEAGESRALLLSNAHVGGSVVLDRGKFTGCVDGTGLSVGHDFRLSDATLSGAPGQAHSRGEELDLRYGGRWRGLSLKLERSTITGNVLARGATLAKTLSLSHSQVGGRVDVKGSKFAPAGEEALIAVRMRAGALDLTVDAPIRGRISLRSARVDVLSDTAAAWSGSAVDIEDFHYERLVSSVPLPSRLAALESATPDFSAQPYEAASRALFLAGATEAARQVMYSSVRRRNGAGTTLVRIWGTLQDVTIGYGYKPLRGVTIALALWLGGWLWFRWGSPGCGEVEAGGLCPAQDPSQPWMPSILSLDLLLPVVDLNQQSAWIFTGSSAAISVVLSMGGWLLLTTIIAAISRAARRER